MDSMTENLLFVRAFCAHGDKQLRALGDEANDSQDALQRLIRDLLRAENDQQVTEIINQVCELGLESGAGDIFRELLRQSLVAPDSNAVTTRSVGLMDPDTGHMLEVDVDMGGTGYHGALTRTDVIHASRDLADHLFPVREAMMGPTPSQPTERRLQVMVRYEDDAGNAEGFAFSLWWSFNAVATGDFADMHPPAGPPLQVVTALLILSGLVVVSVFIATLTAVYQGEELEPARKKQKEMHDLLHELPANINAMAEVNGGKNDDPPRI
jgi:hypothetical protein